MKYNFWIGYSTHKTQVIQQSAQSVAHRFKFFTSTDEFLHFRKKWEAKCQMMKINAVELNVWYFFLSNMKNCWLNKFILSYIALNEYKVIWNFLHYFIELTHFKSVKKLIDILHIENTPITRGIEFHNSWAQNQRDYRNREWERRQTVFGLPLRNGRIVV